MSNELRRLIVKWILSQHDDLVESDLTEQDIQANYIEAKAVFGSDDIILNVLKQEFKEA